ncbi:hypothetical protein [Alkaliflexus imshenetskii]|uniref:hypothetical protein n=1 Tax=Alkaliflexus imshenetskii TaxID=286730 RepID=UPI000478A35A|nr:hypothetical protein [Alkaliflexus imshenetskii]
MIHNPEKILFSWSQDEEEGAAITRDTDVAWVLEIYSPQISEKFIKAYEMNDFYEMRRLTYWALSNQFNDDWVERKTSGFDFPKGKPIANLRHNAQAVDKGLRVYFTENKSFNEDYHGIVGNMLQPIYFKPHHKPKFQDAYFPVDIKLYEGEDELPTGDSYYGSNDFIGEYSEASLVIGIGKGSGFMVGYLRGYGYCEYAYSLKGSGLNLST